MKIINPNTNEPQPGPYADFPVTTPGRNRSASAADLAPPYIAPERMKAYRLPSLMGGERVWPKNSGEKA